MNMEEGEIDIDPQEQVKKDSNALLAEQAKVLGEATQENRGLKEILSKCNAEFKEALGAMTTMDNGLRQKEYYQVGVVMQRAVLRLNDVIKQLDSILGEKKND